MNYYKFFLNVLLCLSFLTFSCSKKSDYQEVNTGSAILKINVNVIDFENGDVVSNSRAKNLAKAKESNIIIDTTIALNSKFLLSAELSNDVSHVSKSSTKILNSNGSYAISSALPIDIWYKVIVYKASNGEYVAERKYQHKKESNTAELKLTKGVEYTFIAYSLNTNNESDLDVLGVSFAGTTLSTHKIRVSDDKDLLVHRENLRMSDEEDNYLNILFKRKFNQITVSIDGSDTGYNISEIIANLVTALGIVELDQYGVVTRIANNKSTPLVFSGIGTPIVTANPVVVNAASGEGLLSITKLTIGDLTSGSAAAPLKPFASVALIAGNKYNIRLKITPTDEYIDDYQGRKAVRVNGKIWMRHNLGVDNNVVPDVIGSSIHGDYFQWGRNISFANGVSNLAEGSIPPNFMTSTNNVPNAWNLGTEASPIRNNSNDPCPAGYRIPTTAELNNLVSNTTSTYISTGVASPTNYSGYAVLKSKRKSSIILTFPAQGYYATPDSPPYSIRRVTNRGVGIYALSSRFFGSNQYDLLSINITGAGVVSRLDEIANTVIGHPVRCIANQ